MKKNCGNIVGIFCGYMCCGLLFILCTMFFMHISITKHRLLYYDIFGNSCFEELIFTYGI